MEFERLINAIPFSDLTSELLWKFLLSFFSRFSRYVDFKHVNFSFFPLVRSKRNSIIAEVPYSRILREKYEYFPKNVSIRF